MELCLVRHAIAGKPGPAYPDDSLRPLTREGRERMQAGAKGLASLLVPEVILTSPLLRARQTADILASATGRPKVMPCEALATGDHDQLLKDAAGMGARRVAAVGHEPHLSALLSHCVAGDAALVDSIFKKGGAGLITFARAAEPGGATLVWFLPPAALRRLA